SHRGRRRVPRGRRQLPGRVARAGSAPARPLRLAVSAVLRPSRAGRARLLLPRPGAGRPGLPVRRPRRPALGTLPADGRLGRDARGYGPLRTRRRGPLHAPLGRPPRLSCAARGTPASRQTRIRSQRRSSTCPGGAPRGLLTSATRQRWTSTRRASHAFECRAASAAARSTTARGRASSLSGLRTTTWLPGTPPATWSQKSSGAASAKVSSSLSASPLPIRTSYPSTTTVLYRRPLLATPRV